MGYHKQMEIDIVVPAFQQERGSYRIAGDHVRVADVSVQELLLPNSSVIRNMSISNSTNTQEEIYDYDYDTTINRVPLSEIVPAALVYGLTLLFGVIGNTLVIISVTRYQRMRSITNIFLLSLASADLLLVCICIPVKFAAFFTFSWTFGVFLCKGVHYLQNVSSVCSVLTLTTMSMERYYAIRHPMRAKYMCTIGRAWRVTFVLWTLSLILALPTVFQRVHKEVGHKVKAFWCVKDWESTLYSRMYEVYMLCLMLVLPLLIMTFAYVSIIKELWAMASLRSSMTRGCIMKRNDWNDVSGHAGGVPNGVNGWWASRRFGGITRFAFKNSATSGSPAQSSSALSSPGRMSERSPVLRAQPGGSDGDDDKTKKQVIKMLVAVIVVFVVCWAPILISNTLTAFGILHHLNYGNLRPVRLAFYLMAYTNSCVNPVIYGFMSKHFRSTFYHALCTCWKSPRNARSRVLHRQTSWQSRSTNIREFGDLELTSVDVTGCGHCNASSV